MLPPEASAKQTFTVAYNAHGSRTPRWTRHRSSGFANDAIPGKMQATTTVFCSHSALEHHACQLCNSCYNRPITDATKRPYDMTLKIQ